MVIFSCLVSFAIILKVTAAWGEQLGPINFKKHTPLRMSSSPDYSSSDSLRVLGVCGGIGSGKSAACKLLVSELSCVAHIDTDSIAHTVYQPGSAVVEQVVQAFGSDILVPGTSVPEIDRKKLGAIVFADPLAMKQLEAIVWPHVQVEIEKRIAGLQTEWKQALKDSSSEQKKNPIVVVEAAVLLDAGWQDAFLDAVWVVTVPDKVAQQRIVENRGISPAEADKRIQAQVSRRGIGNIAQEIQNKVVTATIDNSGSLEDLKEALSKTLEEETAWYSRQLQQQSE